MQRWFIENQFERRKYVRLDANISVKFQIVTDDYSHAISEAFNASTNNVGRGGICVHTRPLKALKDIEFAPEKTKLKLTLTLPGSYIIEGYAVVRWIQNGKNPLRHNFKFGVSYEDFAEPQRDRLIKYALYSWRKRQTRIFILTVTLATVLTLSVLTWYIVYY